MSGGDDDDRDLCRLVVGTYEGFLYGWDVRIESDALGVVSGDLSLAYGYRAHDACIRSVAVMSGSGPRSGRIMASGGSDEAVNLYDLERRVEIGELNRLQRGDISCLEFYTDTNLLSGSEDGSICIWRTTDWECVHVLGGHKGPVRSLAIHPSGRLALSTGQDRTLRMWNLVKGRSAYITKLEAAADQVFWSPSGNRYALLMGRSLVVIDAASNERLATVVHEPLRPNCAAFLGDDVVVTGGEDKQFRVFEADGGRLIRTVDATDHCGGSRIRDLCAVPWRYNGDDGGDEAQGGDGGDGHLPLVAACTSSGTIQLWDLASDEASEEPLASETVRGNPRMTCMTVCSRRDDDDAPRKKKKRHNKKRTRPAVNSAEVEDEEEEEEAAAAAAAARERPNGGGGDKKAKTAAAKKKKAKKAKTGQKAVSFASSVADATTPEEKESKKKKKKKKKSTKK